MGTHAGSAVLSLMYCLSWGRQISTDTMESWENAEHIFGARCKLIMWFGISQRISYSFFSVGFPHTGGHAIQVFAPHLEIYSPAFFSLSEEI